MSLVSHYSEDESLLPSRCSFNFDSIQDSQPAEHASEQPTPSTHRHKLFLFHFFQHCKQLLNLAAERVSQISMDSEKFNPEASGQLDHLGPAACSILFQSILPNATGGVWFQACSRRIFVLPFNVTKCTRESMRSSNNIQAPGSILSFSMRFRTRG